MPSSLLVMLTGSIAPDAGELLLARTDLMATKKEVRNPSKDYRTLMSMCAVLGGPSTRSRSKAEERWLCRCCRCTS